MRANSERIARRTGGIPAAAVLLAILAVSIGAQGAPVASQLPPQLLAYPDLVFYNGKVLTVDREFRVAEAVAVRDGRVLAVGSNAEIRPLIGPRTRAIDIAGNTVAPGFVGSDQDNAFAGGDLYKDTMVNGVVGRQVRGRNVPEMLAQARALVEQAEPGSPVFIRMADEFVSELSKLTAADADVLAPENPLMLSFSSSEGLVNSVMLEKAFGAGLPRDSFGIVRDASGRPTGQLFGQALGFVGWNLRDWPELTEEIFREQERIIDGLVSAGVTTMTGHASGYTITIVNQMYQQGRLKARMRPSIDFNRQNPLAEQFFRRVPNLVDFKLGDGLVRIVGMALGPVDGASDSGGILTNEPKARIHPEIGGGPFGTNKWTGSGFTGRAWGDLTDDERERTEYTTLQLARRYGWNIAGNHNMGSQATTIIMQGLLDAEAQPDIKVHNVLARNSLDHNLIWDEHSIAAAQQLGDRVAFGLNGEIWRQREVRGEEVLYAQYEDRLHTMQPVRDLLEAGLNVHFESFSLRRPPLLIMQRFITRTDESGRVWGPDQAIDRRTALRMATASAAKFISEEDMLGSIEPGKYADLVVLGGDYLGVPDDEIGRLPVIMTIVHGKVVFEK